MTYKDLRGEINPCSSAELDGRCQGSFCPAGFISATWTTFMKLFPALTPLTSSCAISSPHVLLVLHVLLHIWPYILSSAPRCSVQTCWQMTYLGHKQQPISNALPSDGCLSFWCWPLAWNTRGKMILTPHWKICWNIYRHHLNAAPEDLQWP